MFGHSQPTDTMDYSEALLLLYLNMVSPFTQYCFLTMHPYPGPTTDVVPDVFLNKIPTC